MEYQVEDIKSHYVTDKGRVFEVKWLGYEESENTLEPEFNLTKAQDILDNYLRENELPPTPESLTTPDTSDDEEEEYKDNFITATKVLRYVRNYSNLNAYKHEIQTRQYIGQQLEENDDAIHLYLRNDHFYVIAHLMNSWYIVDGENRCMDERVRDKINRETGRILQPLGYKKQTGDDHCGASAVAIILELKRLAKNRQPPGATLDPPSRLAREVTTRLHRQRTKRLEKGAHIPRKPKCMDCQKGFMNETKLRQHRRHCKG